jgi:hypothetical protein
MARSGRHVAPDPEPDPIAGWQPGEFGGRLAGGNVRWGLIAFIAIVVLLTLGVAYWLYQIPSAALEEAEAALGTSAAVLDDSLSGLEAFNEGLAGLDGVANDSSGLAAVDDAARDLFSVSADLADTERTSRASAVAASGAALDAVRLAGDAHAYRAAVTPILVVPELETDPALIELDEAARSFGEWQLRFDEVRKALPDGVLADVTGKLDVLSADLSEILGRYMDALAADDMPASGAVIAGLGDRLDEVGSSLAAALVETQERVQSRIDETRAALSAIVPDPSA